MLFFLARLISIRLSFKNELFFFFKIQSKRHGNVVVTAMNNNLCENEKCYMNMYVHHCQALHTQTSYRNF